MFAKKATVKPYSAVKGSVRKGIASQIATNLECELKSQELALVLPKTLQIAKCITHGGSKGEICISESKTALWILVQSQTVPTVAAVAALPRLVPTVQTVINTLQFLQNGADFMGPGLFGEIPTLKKGQAVQIRALEGNILATGILLQDLSPSRAVTGKLVQVVNVVNDTLVSAAEVKEFATAGKALAQKLESESSAVEEPKPDPDVPSVGEPEVNTESKAAAPVEHKKHEVQLEQSEIDDALIQALDKVLSLPHDLPVTMAHIATELNNNLPFEHEDLQLKYSKFKKMPALLKDAAKQNKLTLKTRQGGELIVMSIAPSTSAGASQAERTSKTKPRQKVTKMDAIELYAPKSMAKKILTNLDAKYMTRKDINTALSTYVEAHGLGNGADLKVDETLAQCLGLKQDVMVISRSQAQTQILKAFNMFHSIQLPGDQADAAPTIRKGAIPTVSVRQENRGGNKTVTIVRNLSAFGIDTKTFASELAVKCASSATTQQPKAAGDSAKGLEVLVQGKHSVTIVKFLESKGMRPQWISH